MKNKITNENTIHRGDLRIGAAVCEVYPDAHFVAGLGWCGPGYAEAAALEGRIFAALHAVAARDACGFTVYKRTAARRIIRGAVQAAKRAA